MSVLIFTAFNWKWSSILCQFYCKCDIPMYGKHYHCSTTGSLSCVYRWTVHVKASIQLLLLCINVLYSTNNSREMFNGRRWQEDPRFFSPMVDRNGSSLLIRDLISFVHPRYSTTTGSIQKFYQKVHV